ncbi:MAG: tRNA-intron lyase [archaeon]|nr:tRNA-intron lyase [archaeon]
MSGELVEDSVVIKNQKESSQLYNKGNYGYPLSGGYLELDLVEALYLVESKRLNVTKNKEVMSFEELFNYASTTLEEFSTKYLVYRDIRSKGFIVKIESGTFDLSVFPRGKTTSNSRPMYVIRAVSERNALDITTFVNDASEIENRGKELIYGVIDEEDDVTYYKMSHRDPKGNVCPEKKCKKTYGHLIVDRVFVFNPTDLQILRRRGFYGKVVENVLHLSLIEACYLIKKGEISVYLSNTKKITSFSSLKKFGRKTQDEFDIRLKAYSDARARGLVVKTGFKYGTHFRAYEESPECCHAKYLIHVVDTKNKTMWPEISRAVRISGGVKKEFLFCMIGDSVKYLEFKWVKL